jgi:ATP-dependent exoDNAse (exonuclease V) alpha subunit
MIELPINYKLPDEAQTALSLLETNPVVYLAGRAGTGKTSAIEYLKTTRASNPLTKNMVVLAPTGVSALNIGAQTIHSFFRIAPHDQPGRWDHSKMNNQVKRMSLLVLDEISMVRADLLDLIDEHMRWHTGTDKPFGGIPVLLVGDVFQLSPVVTRDDQQMFFSKYPSPWFFYANVFKNVLLQCTELTRVYRQKDIQFLELLNNVRLSKNLTESLQILNQTVNADLPVIPMYLSSVNQVADQFNQAHLDKIQEPETVYTADVGSGITASDLRNFQSPQELTLKVGTRVMLTANINDFLGYSANGSCGWVRDLKKRQVLVEFDDGIVRWLSKHTWKKESWNWSNDTNTFELYPKGSYSQIPLRLGWAVSIHRAQGLTLDAVKIDLGSGAFASGQTYVALSRCKTLGGVSLSRPIQEKDVIIDPEVKMFYNWKFPEQ